jgi:hypothetical protein
MIKKIRSNNNRGIIRWIILLVIGIVLASFFFDFDIQKVIEDEQTQSNFEYLTNELKIVYDTYIKEYIDILVIFFQEQIENFTSLEIENTATNE